MLFQKNIEPRCTYCQRGTPLDEEKILCTKQGVVAPRRELPLLQVRPPQAGAAAAGGTRLPAG